MEQTYDKYLSWALTDIETKAHRSFRLSLAERIVEVQAMKSKENAQDEYTINADAGHQLLSEVDE